MHDAANARIKSNRRRNILCACLLAAYVLLNLSFLLCHENWRDEAQAWLLARDLSIPELIEQMSYEGHPCLWHLLLMPLAKLGLPYVSMNVLSLTIMSAAAALLLWKAPLPLPLKALALFGGAFSFYYPVVSRNYCLIPLFAFMMAYFYPARREKPLRYGLSIALMVQTHIIMLGMAAAASLVWLAEAVAGYRRDRERRALLLQGAGLALPLLSFLFLLVQISHPQDATAYTLQASDVLSLPREAVLAAWGLFRPFPAPLNCILALLVMGAFLWFFIRAARKREFALLKAAAIAAAGMALPVRGACAHHFEHDHAHDLQFLYTAVVFLGDVARRQRQMAAPPAGAGAGGDGTGHLPHLSAGVQGIQPAPIRARSTAPPLSRKRCLRTRSSSRSTSRAPPRYCPTFPRATCFTAPMTASRSRSPRGTRRHYAHMALDSYESICAWARETDPRV